MKFLIDAQLPPALADWLVAAGLEAVHVREIGLEAATDSAIWNHALKTERIIITKDEDFTTRSEPAPIIVWLRVGNTTNPALRSWFERRLPGILQLIAQGNRLVEVI